MDKLELKSCHEVIDTVSVADVDSIFYGKPIDPDFLTVVMKNGKMLYCDEVCPIDSLQEEPVSEELEEEIKRWKESFKHCPASMGYKETARHFANWQKQQTIDKAAKWFERLTGLCTFVNDFKKYMED